MPGSAAEVRSAEPPELPLIVGTIVAAFLTDPMARFSWPSSGEYAAAMRKLAGEFGRLSVEHGAADVTPDLAGVAFWTPPNVSADGEVLGEIFTETVSEDRLTDLTIAFEALGRYRPTTPYWHLHMIGVEPRAQGRGIGGVLMTHALARCDEDGTWAYLESSNPRNVSLYELHGFEPLDEIKIGAGPLLTPMLRRPSQP